MIGDRSSTRPATETPICKVSLGTAASDLIRMGLKARGAQRVADEASATVGPFAILPPRDELITPEHIRRIQEQEGV